MIETRKQYSVFGHAQTHILDADNQHCFVFMRENDGGEKLLVVCNFSEHKQQLQRSLLATLNCTSTTDLLSGETVSMEAAPLLLAPYQQLWLLAN
jgi:amylosucrase